MVIFRCFISFVISHYLLYGIINSVKTYIILICHRWMYVLIYNICIWQIELCTIMNYVSFTITLEVNRVVQKTMKGY